MGQWQPLADLAREVQAGTVTAAELVERSLQSLADNSQVDAIIAPLAEPARARAKQLDERIAAGETVGRLAGVPFIAKDNFLVYGADTTAASNILKGFQAPYQATAINRLEAEGAIALDMAPFALGTDTGGSIRLPAAFTGIVGYKPTYGAVSRSGVVAMASSTDCIGPLARTVEDAALVLDIMAARDALDGTTIDKDPAGYVISNEKEKYFGFARDGKPVKFGVIKEYMGEGLEPGVRQQVEAAIEKIRAAGAEVSEVSLPSLPLALAVYYIICPAEVSSNLGRYDGQRFGYSYPNATDLDASYGKSRSVGFGKEAKRRIMIGTYVLSSGYYDAYYKKAQVVRTKLIKEFEQAFEQVDFLVGPTAPGIAFKIGANTDDPLKMYLADILTVAANLVGNPSISIPAGQSEGLPVGLQLMAAQRRDRELLGFAKQTAEIIA
jgi:aspartyl-tRNA(Asn)/glutamyl-tRNA(Gln) amidotransferase subunit A